jgi:hypothetical protein
VRNQRGCIGLPRAQRSALVLRYGIGQVRPRSRREAAGLLGLSRTRLARIERSALRSLVSAGRRSSCERTGVALGTLVAVYGLLAERSFVDGLTTAATSAASGLDLMSTLTAAGEGEGGVAGTRASGGDQGASEDSDGEGDDRPTPAGAPLLGTPFGEVEASPTNPLFIALVAVVLAGAAWVGRGLMRAVR